MTRLTVILLLIFSGIRLYAQSPLQKKLNFKIKDQALAEALYNLSDAAEVDIAFNNSLLPEDRTVSIRAKRKTVEEILSDLLSGTNLGFILTQDNTILIVERPKKKPKQRITISGYLLDEESGEALIGAAVQDSISGRGTYSNSYGFYSLTLPAGDYSLKISYLGYQTKRKFYSLMHSQVLNFRLSPTVTLAEVVIYADEEDARYGTPDLLGRQNLGLSDLKTAPGIGGENDPLRSIHQNTGVQTGADGFGGFTVRGGNVDQNLILLDGVPVYNSLHALGIYSIFNATTVRSAKIVRGVMPARYGGRISSVVDIRTKEGNNRKFSGEAEVGPLSGNILLEGPFKKDTSSWMLSYRRSFIDFYSRPIYRDIRSSETTSGELAYHFYDVNAKANLRLNERNKIYLSVYAGQDIFEDIFNQNFRINQTPAVPPAADTIAALSFEQDQNWGNIIASARWNQIISDKLFANTTLTYTRFFFENIEPRSQLISIDNEVVDSIFNISRFNSNNQDIAGKIDFDYSPSSQHKVLFGASVTAHSFQPRVVQFESNIPIDTFNFVRVAKLDREPLRSEEYDIYAEDEWRVNEQWNINAGMRFSIIRAPGKMYYAWQPRAFVTYEPFNNFFIQAAAGRVVQPVHLLTTTERGRAEDLWVSATSRIKPIESEQYSLGLEYHPSYSWKFTVESYFKSMKNILSFNEGFIQNIDAGSWQNSVVSGEGRARGLEFSIQKPHGKFTTALNYTLASTIRRFEDRNNAEPYRHQFDRRHNFNFSFNQEIGERFNLSMTFVFQSGSLTTVPQASYRFALPSLLFPFRGQVLVYSGLSNVSLPNYHRMDIGANYRWSKGKFGHIVKVGVYNIYNRLNTNYYNVSTDCDNPNDEFCYKQVTLVPVLPYFRYQIKF